MSDARRRRRRVRLVVSLSAAVLLSVALLYTSFAASSEVVTAGELLATAEADRSYKLAGTVTAARRVGSTLVFRIRDPQRADRVAQVRYTGSVPDPFRVGRGVIVTVRGTGPTFVGEHDSLITKCPSKFEAARTSE